MSGKSQASRTANKLARIGRALVDNPVETVLYLPEEWSKRREYRVDYVVDESWEEQLHGLLGAPWPCPDGEQVTDIWARIAAELGERGLNIGRHTYAHYSDGDAALVRAIWCTVLHKRPNVVVETGVARGVTSRAVLEALAVNEAGHLWSIDLPYLFERGLDVQTGAAVPGYCRGRWTYVEGSSRRRLPSVLREVGQVDVFVHDSLHTVRNTKFEMEHIAHALSPGGLMFIDDISTHQAFAAWTGSAEGIRTLVCPSADQEGLFGVVYKY